MKVDNHISTTELRWIINALNHNIAYVKAEMDAAGDGSPIQSFGELVVDGREALVNRIVDMIETKAKIIKII